MSCHTTLKYTFEFIGFLYIYIYCIYIYRYTHTHFEQPHLCWHCMSSCVFSETQDEPLSKYSIQYVCVTSATRARTGITMKGYNAALIYFTDHNHCFTKASTPALQWGQRSVWYLTSEWRWQRGYSVCNLLLLHNRLIFITCQGAETQCQLKLLIFASERLHSIMLCTVSLNPVWPFLKVMRE